ncbi:MAG TPA: FAD/NAD(P)-binding oxidoreductase [Gemmatimonadaceae bacterium]|jgi:NADPH-dependent 2,4-dienoyl-CoA reductase/sulfur reductase-like enzyme
MTHYSHLLVGGGMTADAAARGIREIDANATIGLIGAESHPPYSRPPLSKGLWKDTALASIWSDTAAAGVALHLGRRVTALDPEARQVTDDVGAVYTYDKLLLATGGTPRRLSSDPDDVIYFRTYDDYARLRAMSAVRRKVIVIGGGFIGSEIAAALRMQEHEVTMLMPEEGIGSRVFPADLSRHLVDYFGERGIAVLTGRGVASVRRNDAQTIVTTTTGDALAADAVVAGLGLTPNVELAERAGLEVANGIVVDEFLRTRRPDIYAAGDVANFYSPALDTRRRVEHEDNAVSMGRQAGRNMAGDAVACHHLPFFYSDLFELGYEAVGDLDARLQTVADWKVPFREGVIYYLRDGRVRGVLLWNVWGQLDAARRLIADSGPITASALIGRLPE